LILFVLSEKLALFCIMKKFRLKSFCPAFLKLFLGFFHKEEEALER